VDLNGAAWRKSSYSGGNGGQCVEVAAATANRSEQDRICAIRDSKNSRGPILAFSPGQWRRFTTDVKAGRFGRG
jgi:Domain of unknown function (DUF397)